MDFATGNISCRMEPSPLRDGASIPLLCDLNQQLIAVRTDRVLVQLLVPLKVPLDHRNRSHSSYVRPLSESPQLLFPSAPSASGLSLSLSGIIRLGPTENPGVGSSILPLPTIFSRTCAALVAAFPFSVPATAPAGVVMLIAFQSAR